MSSEFPHLGRWVRHYRKAQGLTLATLAGRVGCANSHLSLVETGKRVPKLALVSKLADELGVDVGQLMSAQPPSRRDELEMALEDAQATPSYHGLGLPVVRTSTAIGDDVLEALVGLHGELDRRTHAAEATPDEARLANVELRAEMRARDNYFAELEQEAAQLLTSVGHTSGPLGERRIEQITQHLGFVIRQAPDLPHGVRSLTDQRNRRIYIAHGSTDQLNPRTAILQALGHQVLGHQRPSSFGEFLKQRVEVNYFAAALLLPEQPVVEMLSRAKQGNYLAVEDLRDAYSVTYETAAHRFTNLATKHLGIPVHFMKAHETGTVYKVYENDNLPVTTDVKGAAEGQIACRFRPARMAFTAVAPGDTHHQYFDTSAGTFWSSVQVTDSAQGRFSISVGVRFDDAKWFRGRETRLRSVSTCPDPACCRRPPKEQFDRWHSSSRPATTAHASLLATLPPGAFPGVDDHAVFEFLEKYDDPG